ncbi:hypothetical protein FPZ43_13835 [Mucilaginibacter pallidiroseus]|uniref:Uncharacterized protein n=1 Tax=Mucilaginibacter pallidiroseus TaxID=2599295 RepID=A0A563U896_9SPHI|nr:hypothetical protein [Mucilaginibacter pallidiroseus]TWR27548.1 hypothetical protein FPZ43_13835 [Mucilaginibacter pallidiroseus]
MKITFAIILASVYGLIIRLMFGFLSDVLEIMSISFLFILPSLIGFLTIILLPLRAVKNRTRAFFLPWLTSLLLFIITVLFSVEGVICWVMVYPFFSTMAGIDGIIAYQFKSNKLKKGTDNPKLKLSLLAILPLFAGLLERDASSATSQYQLSRSVVIEASTVAVWNKITHIRLISSNENRSLFTDVVGFPRHTSTVIDTLIAGGHRKAMFEKGLYFDEVITELKPLQLLTVAIKA